jgi:hypothetical protein
LLLSGCPVQVQEGDRVSVGAFLGEYGEHVLGVLVAPVVGINAAGIAGAWAIDRQMAQDGVIPLVDGIGGRCASNRGGLGQSGQPGGGAGVPRVVSPGEQHRAALRVISLTAIGQSAYLPII